MQKIRLDISGGDENAVVEQQANEVKKATREIIQKIIDKSGCRRGIKISRKQGASVNNTPGPELVKV